MSAAVTNQYSALQSPSTTESKSWEAQGRNLKDDAKEQAHQAKTQVKGKAAQLQEQVIAGANTGIDMAKQKAAQIAGKPALAAKSAEQLVDDASDAANEQWAEVKRRGGKAAKQAANEVDAQLDSNLTPQQRAQLKKGVRQAKGAGLRVQAEADGLVDRALSVAPQLRPIRNFVQQYHLQLPILVIGALLSLWLSLSLIRTLTAPSATPELDIHSLSSSKSWLKWHAGEYKNRALDSKEDLSGRAAHFLANHNLDSLQEQAINWRDIGINKLGLREPTWSEWAMGYITGAPLTWQERVASVLHSAKAGLLSSKDLSKAQLLNAHSSLKDHLGWTEPTMWEKATNWALGRDTSLQARIKAQALKAGGVGSGLGSKLNGGIDSIKAGVNSGIDSISAKIPHTSAHDAAELAKAKAYAATHQSTLGKVASQAEYVKNRIVHGAEEAAHRADEAAKKIMDEAKLKTGL